MECKSTEPFGMDVRSAHRRELTPDQPTRARSRMCARPTYRWSLHTISWCGGQEGSGAGYDTRLKGARRNDADVRSACDRPDRPTAQGGRVVREGRDEDNTLNSARKRTGEVRDAAAPPRPYYHARRPAPQPRPNQSAMRRWMCVGRAGDRERITKEELEIARSPARISICARARGGGTRTTGCALLHRVSAPKTSSIPPAQVVAGAVGISGSAGIATRDGRTPRPMGAVSFGWVDLGVGRTQRTYAIIRGGFLDQWTGGRRRAVGGGRVKGVLVPLRGAVSLVRMSREKCASVAMPPFGNRRSVLGPVSDIRGSGNSRDRHWSALFGSGNQRSPALPSMESGGPHWRPIVSIAPSDLQWSLLEFNGSGLVFSLAFDLAETAVFYQFPLDFRSLTESSQASIIVI
ncbi:hypothetical protein B0H17DRAFT_1149195 [Mycena rosella]|uniref:Uncharacterized protein n=1 Tax=Mycena rosella TaxID=1033263 RepID=A0AAD7C687_MYCRO|nr:hypothetical protein B0H17DRAFT_1149195 [Mycena rosella]